MSEYTKIQWTDVSWNIARGCTKVDEDCKFCYMYRDSMGNTRYDPKQIIRTKTVFNLPDRIKEPSKIFTCSLTDFFHEAIDEYRNEAWEIIRRHPEHTFQILTKRPERIIQHLPSDWGDGWNNVWLGTSVGSNKAMSRMYDLLDMPAKIHFVSFEPIHEHIEMNIDIGTLIKIDWAIIGGESGNDNGKYRYRPCQVEWIEEIVTAITSVGNAVFVKQMGTFIAKQNRYKDRHGGNINEWPEHLKIRQFPL